MRVLVLGVTGMLGHAVFKAFAGDPHHEAWGTLRDASARRFFDAVNHPHLVAGVDALDHDAMTAVMIRVRPEIVINCVGLVKQLAAANDPLLALPINAILPHKLARLCALVGARLIHMSTDCVFSGRKGGYCETDVSDAEDVYGKSKFIGELRDVPNAITLRSSIIGHELNSSKGLLEWFLSQRDQVNGYANAVFSGLPAVELARAMRDFIVPHTKLSGLYHVSATPIVKLELLKLIANVYGKDIDIVPDSRMAVDRSLNSERFTRATGYVAPGWPELITLMHAAT